MRRRTKVSTVFSVTEYSSRARSYDEKRGFDRVGNQLSHPGSEDSSNFVTQRRSRLPCVRFDLVLANVYGKNAALLMTLLEHYPKLSLELAVDITKILIRISRFLRERA